MPEPSRILTLATLKRKGACADQLALFRAKFGDYVVVTEALCVEHAAAFNWSWGAGKLLRAPAQAACAAAIAPPRAAIAPPRAAILPARAAYQVTQAGAFARAYINDTI